MDTSMNIVWIHLESWLIFDNTHTRICTLENPAVATCSHMCIHTHYTHTIENPAVAQGPMRENPAVTVGVSVGRYEST
jgi:hypothetical protein